MKITAAINLLFVLFSSNALAEWVKIGENNRSVVYIDTTIRKSADSKLVWLMFDYKLTQQSPKSGRRYLTEKAQWEFDCKAERLRTLYSSWHSEHMGYGVVVYEGASNGAWLPSSAPKSFGSAAWLFACDKNGKIN